MKELLEDITWWTITIVLFFCVLPLMIIGSILISIDNLRDIFVKEWKR